MAEGMDRNLGLEAVRVTEAAALAETALGLLQDNEDELRGEIIERHKLYLANKPYRQTIPQD